MISPSSPSDTRSTTPTHPHIQCVPSASASASFSASPPPPGHTRDQCVRPSPTPTGTDALIEPSADAPTGASDTASETRTCRACGCTDWTACLDDFQQPCYWIEPDLCSQCRAHAEACS